MPPDGAYPAGYEDRIRLRDGRELFLRPILQTDGDLLLDLFNRLSPESIRMRFLRQIRFLPEDMLYQFTHVNYDSEFALVGVVREGEKDAIVAVGRYAFDPEANATDFGVVVRDDWQNNGLGRLLLSRIIAIGREHGISRFATVIAPENRTIMKMITELGYDVKSSFSDGAYIFELFV